MTYAFQPSKRRGGLGMEHKFQQMSWFSVLWNLIRHLAMKFPCKKDILMFFNLHSANQYGWPKNTIKWSSCTSFLLNSLETFHWTAMFVVPGIFTDEFCGKFTRPNLRNSSKADRWGQISSDGPVDRAPSKSYSIYIYTYTCCLCVFVYITGSI